MIARSLDKFHYGYVLNLMSAANEYGQADHFVKEIKGRSKNT